MAEGDRLTIFATVEGLQHIEQGKLNLDAKHYYVHVQKALNAEAKFNGANLIVLMSECSFPEARDLFDHLPATLDIPLYKHQAMRLIHGLLLSTSTS